MDQLGNKDFKGWIKLKAKLHYEAHICAIKNGDIWWCGFGENVGAEINGKTKTFARPVLVLRKLSRYNFIGVPLTSKRHEGSWYVSFDFKGKKEIAFIAQTRNVSVSRLYNKMGEIPESDLENVRRKLCDLILEKILPNLAIRVDGYPRIYFYYISYEENRQEIIRLFYKNYHFL